MALTTDTQLERTAHLADDRVLFEMHFALLGAPDLNLTATIETERYAHPIVTASDNTFGLHPADEDALVLAAYKAMRRYFHGGPTGGDVWWVRWMEPDLTPWIRSSLKPAAADRVIAVLGSHVDPTKPPLIGSRYTESAEG